MSQVSCSDGAHGLLSRYATQANLPNFPLIGGASAISGWGSDQCGTCWQLQYGSNTVKIIAMDHAGDGFNIAQKAMDILTNGQSVQLGAVDATATQLSASDCGL